MIGRANHTQDLSGQMTPTHSLYTREGGKVAIAVDFDLGKSKVKKMCIRDRS